MCFNTFLFWSVFGHLTESWIILHPDNQHVGWSSTLLIFVFLMVLGLISLTFHTTCTPKYLRSLVVHRIGIEVNVFVNLDLYGHDATAAATNWVLYLLAHDSEAQREVHRDMDKVFVVFSIHPLSRLKKWM